MIVCVIFPKFIVHSLSDPHILTARERCVEMRHTFHSAKCAMCVRQMHRGSIPCWCCVHVGIFFLWPGPNVFLFNCGQSRRVSTIQAAAHYTCVSNGWAPRRQGEGGGLQSMFMIPVYLNERGRLLHGL